MVTHKELLTAYNGKFADLHVQVREKTHCSEEEVADLFAEVLYQARQEEQYLSELRSDPQFLYNELRYRAIRHKRHAALFKDVSLQEQHRFCQYVKGQLPAPPPAHIDVHAAVKQALHYARQDLGHLTFTDREYAREQLLVWIQSYLDREVQILLFTEKWKSLQSWLERQARKQTKTAEEAEDLLMQTFFKALRYIRVHHKLPDEEKTRAWITTIMTHAYLDDVRDQGTIRLEPLEDQIDPPSDEEDVERQVINGLGREELARIIFLLTEDARTVMDMHLLQDIPLSEIADKLGKKLETIRARAKRARPHLIAHLPAKTLAEYLARVPDVSARLQKVLPGYIPGRTAKNYKLTGLYRETEHEIRVRSILSLHIAGCDSREIADLLTVEKKSTETAAAFAQRLATAQKDIEQCLQENLPRLFSFLYEKKR